MIANPHECNGSTGDYIKIYPDDTFIARFDGYSAGTWDEEDGKIYLLAFTGVFSTICICEYLYSGEIPQVGTFD